MPLLRDADERGGDLAHLARLAGQAVGQRARHGLHGVDDEEFGGDLVDLAEDRGEVGLGGEVQLVVEGARAAGAEPDLGGGLLGAHVEHAAAGGGDPRGDLEEQRGLADARLAREQDGRTRDDAAAEHPVELADAARPVRGILGLDLADRPGGARRARRHRLQRAHDAGLLRDVDDGAPLLALGASADPLHGAPTALGAPERGGGLGHALSLGVAHDIRWPHPGVADGRTLNPCERTSTSSSSGAVRPAWRSVTASRHPVSITWCSSRVAWARAWDGRWDSFRLVTPNHTIRLPGGEYRGAEPDGFLARDEIAGPPPAATPRRSPHRSSRARESTPSRPTTAASPPRPPRAASTPGGSSSARARTSARIARPSSPTSSARFRSWTRPSTARPPRSPTVGCS